MLAGHRERHPPCKLPGLLGVRVPTADQAAEAVDVQAERPRMVIDVSPCQRRLADAGRTIQMHEARHQRTLRASAAALWNGTFAAFSFRESCARVARPRSC